MISFDEAVKENIKKLNSNWQQIPDHSYRILIIGGSGSRKTNSSFNLVNNQSDIDKIYLYVEDPYEAKYQFLIKKREDIGKKHFHDLKAVIEYSNNMVDIYEKIEDYDPNKKRKILIAINFLVMNLFNSNWIVYYR